MSENKRAIAYIDGFNLYSGLMAKGWGSYRWLDIGKLAEVLCPSGYDVELIRYFTTRIKGNHPKHQRQQVYLNALQSFLYPKYRCMFGRFQLFPSRCKNCGEKPLKCHNCGQKYIKPNEKKTDVNIATSMLVDCIEDNTDAIILISGDSDFETPLNEINRLFPSIYRMIAFPPKRQNPRLFGFCNKHTKININHFRSVGLLPDPVVNPNTGKKYSKPASW